MHECMNNIITSCFGADGASFRMLEMNGQVAGQYPMVLSVPIIFVELVHESRNSYLCSAFSTISNCFPKLRNMRCGGACPFIVL